MLAEICTADSDAWQLGKSRTRLPSFALGGRPVSTPAPAAEVTSARFPFDNRHGCRYDSGIGIEESSRMLALYALIAILAVAGVAIVYSLLN